MSRGMGVDGQSLASHPHVPAGAAEQPRAAPPGFRPPPYKIYLECPLGILEMIHLECLRPRQCPGQWGLKRPLGYSVGLSPRS